MTISRSEEWVQIARLDEADQIRFTAEFQSLMGDLGWEAKAFVGHLLGLWYDPFEHLLDYSSGEATCSQDQPGQFIGSLDGPHLKMRYPLYAALCLGRRPVRGCPKTPVLSPFAPRKYTLSRSERRQWPGKR